MSDGQDSAGGQPTTDTAQAAAPAPTPAPAPAPAASLLSDGAAEAAAPPPAPAEAAKAEPTAEEAQAAADAAAQAEADAAAKNAPEKYEDFAAPEGITFDAEVTDEFKALAKDLNLPQAKAQQVMDLAAKHSQKVAEQQAAAQQAVVDQWVADVKADKEFGGDKLDESLAGARKVLAEFGTPELKKLMDSPFGNNPEVVRLLVRVSKKISEDGFVTGKPADASGATTAQRMYPNMNP